MALRAYVLIINPESKPTAALQRVSHLLAESRTLPGTLVQWHTQPYCSALQLRHYVAQLMTIRLHVLDTQLL